MRNYFKQGDWIAYCDRCKFKRFASELMKEYTGCMVCSDCFDIRHPQELRRQPKEIESVPWSRPTHAGADIDPGFVVTPPAIPT